ncbi:hypothetical protein AN403_5328 [Pseudomonas fluorescens]|uniref:Uncharacterized protein n=1 Tax=Pseudomonas fluorescens TaxID=294 RepID=A0A0P8Z7I1_PSEFL|nr:hypothetical protein AN403_5328 [Pseudomonas fluorescens]
MVAESTECTRPLLLWTLYPLNQQLTSALNGLKLSKTPLF